MLDVNEWTIADLKREIDAIGLEAEALKKRKVPPQAKLEALTEERRELYGLLELLVPEAMARAERFAEFWKSKNLPEILVVERGGTDIVDNPMTALTLESENKRGVIRFNLAFLLRSKILIFQSQLDASFPPKADPRFFPLAIEISRIIGAKSPKMNEHGTVFEWEGVDFELFQELEKSPQT